MFASSNALDPTAFPSLQRMENDLVAMAGGLLDAPTGYAGSVTSGGTESILLAVLAAREAARSREPEHGPAHDGARRVPQGREVPRGPPGARRRRPADAARGSARDGRGDRRVHGARRRLRPVVRPRSRRPGGRDRRAGGGARHPVPRRRVHRRLGAPAPHGRPPVVLRRGRRDEHQRRPAQVRLHPEGRLRPAPPLGRSCAPATSSPRPTGRATRCSTPRCSPPARAVRWPRPGR